MTDDRASASERRRPLPGAPNVVMIVLDDLGFADLGCYGSEIATPHIDGLAADGLRYNGFHVTALCSSTRSCLLTGRNHHAVGMGLLPELALGFPGYNGRIPKSAATLARVLRDSGYSTHAVGKWHLTPWFEQSAAGPFDRWPLGMGFERFYGFVGGVTSQWAPDLVSDNGFVDPPHSPEEGYHLTEDLVAQAIRLVQDQQQAAPGKPFFLYLAPGAVHYPHHVPGPWVKRYHHRFDDGWEAVRHERFVRQQEVGVVPAGTTLTPRPPWVEPWDHLRSDERRLYARQMEVYAAFLAHTDAQVGRLLDFLVRIGAMDNTMVMVLSDNGASAEGGPRGWTNPAGFGQAEGDGADLETRLSRMDDLGGFGTYDHYAWGWAWAGNTPFKLWKRYSWLGGTRVPLVVRWPAGIAGDQRGQVRTQFCHAIDLLPTIVAAAGIDAPEMVDGACQQPIDGKSLLGTFSHAGAPAPRQTQYFEVFGSRAIYHDGWKATTNHVHHALSAERELLQGSHSFETDEWSLSCLTRDFSEADDLASVEPARLRHMVELWWHEAGRYQVLPLIESGGDDELIVNAREPPPYPPGAEYVFWPAGGPIAAPLSVDGFRLRADLEITDGHARTEGVVCACGDWNGGWACYFLAGRVMLTFNLGGTVSCLAAPGPLGAGAHTVEIDYVPGPNGVATVRVDNRVVAAGPVAGDAVHLETLNYYGKLLVGRDRGFPVCADYQPPFPFTGEIRRVCLAALAPTSPAGRQENHPQGRD